MFKIAFSWKPKVEFQSMKCDNFKTNMLVFFKNFCNLYYFKTIAPLILHLKKSNTEI